MKGTCLPEKAGTACGAGVCDGAGVCSDGAHLFSTLLGTNGVWLHNVATDAKDNVFIFGDFTKNVTFGGDNHTAVGTQDMMLAKLNSSGTPVWSDTYGAASAEQYAESMAVDSAGNVFFTGHLAGDALGFFHCAMTSGGGFIAKADPDGMLQWCHEFAANSLLVAVDSKGNSILTGKFSGDVSFGGAQLSTNSAAIFLAKYDAGGKHLYSEAFDSTVSEAPVAIVVHADDSYSLIGKFEGALGFGGSPLSGKGLFVARRTAANSHEWSKSFDGDLLVTVATGSASGEIFVAARFTGAIDFGNGTLVAGGADIALAKLDSTGNALWTEQVSGTFSEPYDVAVDASGNSAFAGTFDGSLTIGETLMAQPNKAGIFLAKRASDGTHLYAKSWSVDEHNRAGVAFDSGGNLWFGGDLIGTINFGGADLSSAEEGSFLVKLSP